MASVWAELKRRNVVKVAVAYAIVGWILIEISATVFPIVKLPDWTVTFVTMLVLLGFPVALILSWAFELTPDGFKPSNEVEQSTSITSVTGQKLNYAIIGFLVFAVGFMFLDNYILEDDLGDPLTVEAPGGTEPEREAATVDAEKSIAVLAFVNMSNDPEQEYFSDGIAEEILNGLVKVPGLRVAARTSAFSFKGQNIDVREVGETLNVNHVLEGSVRKAGDRLRITAQLISVDDGYHLWSETFDREADDIFAIQDEIALAVVDALEVTLGLGEDEQLVAPGTTNSEAYNWFLRGNYYIQIQNADAFDKAIESYTMAIELDPEFAGGHGGLAYGLAYGALFYPYTQVAATVRTSYRRALEIDENQTEALLGKAVDLAVSEYNYIDAEKAVRRALAGGSNRTAVTDAYWWILLIVQRRFDEALELLTVAEEADPLSALVQQGFGSVYLWKGDYLDAIPYLESGLELNPNDFFGTWSLVVAYTKSGQHAEAESTLQQLELLTGSDNGWSLSARAELLLSQGDEPGSREALEQMIALHESGNEEPILVPMISVIYGLLGDDEDAMNWFEIGAESPNIINSRFPALMFYPRTELWNNPRFQEFVKMMNIDDASVAEARAAIASKQL